ncbi:hypothetical protein ERO13_A06G190851v2, partial [Gossypium hirsutum]
RENIQKWRRRRRSEKGRKKEETESTTITTKTVGMDPMAKLVINETVTQGDVAQNPNDVLAFSRSVHNIDSSLE